MRTLQASLLHNSLDRSHCVRAGQIQYGYYSTQIYEISH